MEYNLAPPKLTSKDIDFWKNEIESHMDHIHMAILYRFAPFGHPIFSDAYLASVFADKFKKAGGMTPEISKKISGY